MFALENMIERVMTCDGCGLGRLLPLPNSAQFAEFYPTAYYGTQGAKFEALTELFGPSAVLAASTLSRERPTGGIASARCRMWPRNDSQCISADEVRGSRGRAELRSGSGNDGQCPHSIGGTSR